MEKKTKCICTCEKCGTDWTMTGEPEVCAGCGRTKSDGIIKVVELENFICDSCGMGCYVDAGYGICPSCGERNVKSI